MNKPWKENKQGRGFLAVGKIITCKEILLASNQHTNNDTYDWLIALFEW
jgi:hypothetical protein